MSHVQHVRKVDEMLGTRALVVLLAVVAGACGDDEGKAAVAPIRIKGPMGETGAYAALGAQSIWGTQAVLHWVNDTRGGIDVNGSKRPLEYRYIDDQSSNDKAKEIALQICAEPGVDFIWGSYGSGPNGAAAEAANACGKLMLDFGGASDAIFANGYTTVVQVLSPSSAYHRGVADLLSSLAAGQPLRVAFLYENDSFSLSVAGPAKTYAAAKGFAVVYDKVYPKNATRESADLQVKIDEIAALSPPVDVVVGGGHDNDGIAIPTLLAQRGVSPKAISLLVAPASHDYYELVQTCPAPCNYAAQPAEGVLTPEQWTVGAKYGPEAAVQEGAEWFGPTQEEFLAEYRAIAGMDQTPNYQAAQAGAAVLALALAVEKAHSTETMAVRGALGDMAFMSYFGHFAIDSTGLQVGHKMVESQWQQGKKQIVWPRSAATTQAVYPMP